MDPQQRLIHFSGSVQGVGFRYTVLRLAEGRNVTGYVRNLPDGRVELLAEGTPAEIDEFLGAIRRRMGHYIREVTDQAVHSDQHFGDFRIRL